MSLYKKIPSSESISQGDIIFGLPILEPVIENVSTLSDFSLKSIGDHAAFDVVVTDIIILSQACDLVKDDEKGRKPLESVVCAAIFPISDFQRNELGDINSKRKPAYYFLHNEHKFLDITYVIDFTSIKTIPYKYLELFASKSGERIRPTNPYLEQISHHLGNYFSRVGSDFERTTQSLKAEYDLLNATSQK